MASHGISLGWWLLSCMGCPALALCPESVWERPVAMEWQQEAMRQVQGNSGEETGRSLSLPPAAEVSSILTISLDPHRRLCSLLGRNDPSCRKITWHFFLSMLTSHPKTWEFGVLSGLGLSKNENNYFYLLLSREPVGKLVLQSKELCLWQLWGWYLPQ